MVTKGELQRARDLLAERGHKKRDYVGRTGRVCIAGAYLLSREDVQLVEYGSYSPAFESEWLARQHRSLNDLALVLGFSDIGRMLDWNDESGTQARALRRYDEAIASFE